MNRLGYSKKFNVLLTSSGRLLKRTMSTLFKYFNYMLKGSKCKLNVINPTKNVF